MDYEAPGGLIAGVDNTYINTADPFGDKPVQAWAADQALERPPPDQTRVPASATGSRSWAITTITSRTTTWSRDFTQDYDSNEFGLGAAVKVMPLTWAFIRYYYGERDYNSYAFGVTESNDADLTGTG